MLLKIMLLKNFAVSCCLNILKKHEFRLNVQISRNKLSSERGMAVLFKAQPLPASSLHGPRNRLPLTSPCAARASNFVSIFQQHDSQFKQPRLFPNICLTIPNNDTENCHETHSFFSQHAFCLWITGNYRRNCNNCRLT